MKPVVALDIDGTLNLSAIATRHSGGSVMDMSTEPWRASIICSDGVMRTERYLPGRGRRGSAGTNTTDPVARHCELLAGMAETLAAILPTDDESGK